MTGQSLRRCLMALLAVVLVLSGCSGLPTEGEVQKGRAIDNEDARPDVGQQPEPPEPGSGMEDVVEGFLRAHIGASEGFRTAREYLSGAAKRSWNPDQRILILDTSNLNPRRATGSRIIVSATAIGEVDAGGHLTEFPTRQNRRLQIGLGKVDGEWRVTEVPSDLGLWLSIADFKKGYQPRTVYFAPERGPRTLIPDTRWLPDAGLATALARAVIGAPPKWLAETARRPLPTSTRLQPRTISVSSRTRIATVTLSRAALRASPEDRKALWASMIQTLNQVPGVGRVEIKVGKSTLQVAGIEGDRSLERLQYAVPEAPSGPVVVRSGNQLGWARTTDERDQRDGSGAGSEQEDLPTVSGQWDQLAADTRGREIAGVSGDRTQIGRWTAGRLTTRPSFGSDLVRPSYDGQGGLWVAGRALGAVRDRDASKKGDDDEVKRAEGPPTIWLIDTRRPPAQAQAEPVSAPWLGSREVRSIAVSPDAHRVALVVEDKSGRRSLLLAAVTRDRSGDVAGLATPVEVNPAVQEATSVTWTDESTLGVLGHTVRSSDDVPMLVPVGGLVETLGPPVAGATTIVGSTLAQNHVFVVTDRNSVQHRLGRAWERFVKASDLVTPAR